MLLLDTFRAIVFGGKGVGSETKPCPEQFTVTEKVGCLPGTISNLVGSQVQFLLQSFLN